MTNEGAFPVRQSSMALTTSDPAAIAAAEGVKARVQAAYLMALEKPRNEAAARDRILMACKRTEFAERAEYAKPVGTAKIKGPTIRFAELALREWGNALSEIQVLYEDADYRRLRISVLDLETNTQFSKDVQIRKVIERKSMRNREDDLIGERKNSYGDTVYILRATDDEMYTKEAAWASKVLRNEGLRLIPTDIIEEGLAQARQTLAARGNQDPEGEKKRVFDSFSGVGVSPKELEKYIGHAISTVSVSEITELRGVYRSIADGESSWNDHLVQKVGGEGEPPNPTEGTLDFDKDFLPELLKDNTQEKIDLFLAACASGGKPVDVIKANAANDQENFKKTLAGWKAPEEKQSLFDRIMLMRGQFEGFTRGNIKKIAELTEEEQAKIKEKWLTKDIGPWPLDPVEEALSDAKCNNDTKFEEEMEFFGAELSSFAKFMDNNGYSSISSNPADEQDIVLAAMKAALDQQNEG